MRNSFSQAKRKRQRRARAQVNEALELANFALTDSSESSINGDFLTENENEIDDCNEVDSVNSNVDIGESDEVGNDMGTNNDNYIVNDTNINEHEGTDDERNNMSDNEGIEERNYDSGDESEPENVHFYEEVIAEANEELNNGNQEEYLRRVLREWARRGVSLKKIDSLLKLLHPVCPFLPLTYNALLGTPHRIDALPALGNGKFWYKGIIMKNLEQRLTQDYLLKHGEIVLDINIDG